jgi:8-oxo-dGTP diphosphatase
MYRYTMTIINYYETLPKKRMAVGVIFLDEQEHLLVVKPTYRAYWLLPGGVVEDNESPQQACRREVQEELQLQVAIDRLLCVDYLPTENEKSECIQFVFYGGLLSQKHIQSIVLPADELSAYRFSSYEEALQLLGTKLAARLPHCFQALQKNTVTYLENGQATSSMETERHSS